MVLVHCDLGSVLCLWVYWENWSAGGLYSLKAAPLKSNLEVDFDRFVLLKLDVGNIFHVPKTSLFSVCQSSHLLILLFFFVYPFSPKSVFQYQVEGVSKAILIFLPVDCTGWKSVKDFFQRCNLPFLFMVCHYLLQPFIPSPSWSFSPSIDLML